MDSCILSYSYNPSCIIKFKFTLSGNKNLWNQGSQRGGGGVEKSLEGELSDNSRQIVYLWYKSGQYH